MGEHSRKNLEIGRINRRRDKELAVDRWESWADQI